MSDTSHGNLSASSAGLSKGLTWVLAASLVLNLLIVGAALGSRWSHERHGGGGSANRGDLSVGGFARRLPPERGKAIRKILRENRPDVGPLRAEVVAARKDAAAALAAEPFDAGRLTAAFERVDAAMARERAAWRAGLFKAAESMTPEERRDLGQWWQEKRPGLFRDRMGRGEGGRRDGDRRRRRVDGAPDGAAGDAPAGVDATE